MRFVLFMDSKKLEGLESLVTTGHFTMTIGGDQCFWRIVFCVVILEKQNKNSIQKRKTMLLQAVRSESVKETEGLSFSSLRSFTTQ